MRGGLLAFLGVLWVLPAGLLASPAAPRTHKRKTVHRRHYRRRHYSRYRYHLAHLHMHRERIEQIQGALIEKGYLDGKPSGRWDERTRAAMRSFQQANGFDATGLPEAKTLMKLGLGPHPLPPGLASAPAESSSSSNSPSGGDPPPKQPDSASQPHSTDGP